MIIVFKLLLFKEHIKNGGGAARNDVVFSRVKKTDLNQHVCGSVGIATTVAICQNRGESFE